MQRKYCSENFDFFFEFFLKYLVEKFSMDLLGNWWRLPVFPGVIFFAMFALLALMVLDNSNSPKLSSNLVTDQIISINFISNTYGAATSPENDPFDVPKPATAAFDAQMPPNTEGYARAHMTAAAAGDHGETEHDKNFAKQPLPTTEDSAFSINGQFDVESLVTSYADTWYNARKKHEKFFLPVYARNNLTGLENSCEPIEHRKDRSDRIVHLALGVISTPDLEGRSRREAWRQTYHAWPLQIRQNVEMRFFIGLPQEKEYLKELEEELELHGDLIILGHIDNFSNITMKTISVFAWGAEACGAYFVFKSSDDTYVHLPRLLDRLYRVSPSNMYTGNSYQSESYYPVRDRNNRWYMPLKEYPFTRGPGYMRGCLVGLSWDLSFYVGQLRQVPNFHWLAFDDTTLGYIVASRRPKMLQLPLTFTTGDCRDDALAVHDVLEGKMALLQSNVDAGRPLCAGYKQMGY